MHDCVKCLGKAPGFKEATKWMDRRNKIPGNQYREWLKANPMPEYDMDYEEGQLGKDGLYHCKQGHKWKYGADGGWAGTEIIFVE